MDEREEIIISQLKDGKEAAWRYVFDHHFAALCYIAYQYVEDDFMAETIVSDVIFHMWEKRGELRIDTSLRNYLARSVRNRCLDWLKTEGRRKEQPISECPDSLSSIGRYLDNSSSPLGQLVADELEEVVEKAIAHLPDSCRRVFELSRKEGKDNHEIAKELGLSVVTVRYHLREALSILRNVLGKYLIAVILFHITG